MEDSLEHFFVCPRIRQVIGVWGPVLEIRHFFLLEGSQRFREGMALLVHALYTWHNFLRHHSSFKITRKGLWENIRETAFRGKYKFFDEFRRGNLPMF